MAPFFSVVTVTFDNAAGLAPTRDSVLAQDFADYEWIVIDGGSRDGSVALLQAIDDPRLRFVSERDDGLYDAMAKGLAQARGDYVIWMNAGDRFAVPDVLSRTRATLGTARPAIAFGDSFEEGDGARFFKPARPPAQNAYVMFTHHQSIFYRTQAARIVGFDHGYRMICDWVMTSRLLATPGPAPVKLPFAVSVFERGGVSQGKRMRGVFNRELYRIYREVHRHPPLRAARYWLAKVGANKLRALLPGIYDRLRYRRPPAGA